MNSQELRHDAHCRVCRSKTIKELFRLQPTPPEDLFLVKSKCYLSTNTYPLVLAMCENCGYIHLPYILNPEISYSNYIYETRVTVGLDSHYQKYAKDVTAFAQLAKNSFVIDLGSNDGTMLRAFKTCGMKVLGVEPNKGLAKISNDSDLKTINGYFNCRVASEISNNYGKALIVTANYMYANIDNVVGFTQNVLKVLREDGLFVVQTGYHAEQMKLNMFDYIYHEHFSYFTVTVLEKLLSACGMELIRVELHSEKGGSIRIYAQPRSGRRARDSTVGKFLLKEKKIGLHGTKIYSELVSKINRKKKELVDFLSRVKSNGNSVIGYGASHSTTTLTHHFELSSHLSYIVDDNPSKVGLYSPGHHLPVYSSEKLYEDKLAYLIILAWQHMNSILSRHKSLLGKGVKFIVPLPTLQIIE